VEARVRHDLRHQGCMHGMTSTFGDNVTEQWTANQGEITDEIQNLVAAALIQESEPAGIHNTISVETDRIFQLGSSNQPHVAHLIQLVGKPERPRRSN